MERGRLSIPAHLGWISMLCQGDIRSHQDVLTVPAEVTTQMCGEGEKGMGEGTCGAIGATSGSKHRHVTGKLFRGMKLLVIFLFPEWLLHTAVLKIH